MEGSVEPKANCDYPGTDPRSPSEGLEGQVLGSTSLAIRTAESCLGGVGPGGSGYVKCRRFEGSESIDLVDCDLPQKSKGKDGVDKYNYALTAAFWEALLAGWVRYIPPFCFKIDS